MHAEKAKIVTSPQTRCDQFLFRQRWRWLLHDPLDFGYGDAEDHRAIADTLDKIAGPLVSMYAKKSGQTEDQVKALLAADSLLTAEECKALGLCDTVTWAVTATAKFETDRMPTACCDRPVSSEARVGEHSGVTWKLVNWAPPAASASTFGVSMSEP